MQNPAAAPGFTWSYSHLKNFETCPKRYYHYQVAKDVKEEESTQLAEGHALHKAFELRLKGTPLPFAYTMHEPLLAKVIAAPGETYGEQKMALTSTFQPSPFFGKAVWMRTVIDALKLTDETATVLDWKTGKVKSDMTQCQIMAATLFHHKASLQRVRTALVFTEHGEIESEEFTRSDLPEIWNEILPRVKQLVTAKQKQEYPAKPSGLCKRYCQVVSCPHHGVGSLR
jgi:hypothetical protein